MSQSHKRIFVVIPAKGKSKRLKNKNILPIKKTPMFVYVANKIKKSTKIYDVIVSTEDKKIIDICKKNNINFIKRPVKLTRSNIEKQEAVVHATKFLIKKKLNPYTIISLQPNSPQVTLKDLHAALNFFNKKLYVKEKIKELICVNRNNIQNPSFRILTVNAVFQKTLSTKIGIYKADYIDVHTKSDYIKVKKIIEKKI
jgi:CMP-N-acetylneuraminic acid synthetase